jgi:hypothetical protein
MAVPRLSVSVTALLVLLATDTAAAPTATADKPIPGKRRKFQDQCPTPDEDQCLEAGYLDSVCGRRHRDVCTPFVHDAMEAHYQSSTVPKVKMLRPKQTDMPKHVQRGKYFAYKKLAARRSRDDRESE